jgi:hypothetical protein
MAKTHSDNPYGGFRAHQFPTGLQGWDSEPAILEQNISTYRPFVISRWPRGRPITAPVR